MTRRRAFIGAVLAVTLTVVGYAGPAWADECSECGPPTLEQLEEQPGFEREVRTNGPWGAVDDVHLTGGECTATIEGSPTVVRTNSWLVLRGSGEVWNCPHSKSLDTITASVSEGDMREWTLSGELGVSFKIGSLSLGAKLTKTVREQVHLETVTSISKKVQAVYCRRIGWWAYFLVADHVASVDYSLKRHWTWETTNDVTGDAVWSDGEMWLDCGGGTASFDATAPISGYFRLRERPCSDPMCSAVTPRDLGFFPPLPSGIPRPPPVVTEEEDGEEPAVAGDGEDTDRSDDDPPRSSGELGEAPTGPSRPPPGFDEDDPADRWAAS